MTRREQLIINDYCEQELEKLYVEMEGVWKGTRLRTTKAFVYETSSYYVLRSYNTFVAFIRKSDGTCFDILCKVYGYTNTSAQHIAKFRKDYNAEYIQVWREV